jgi:hypothetical protein
MVTNKNLDTILGSLSDPACYVHHRRLPDLGDVGVCGLFYKLQ